MTEALMTVIEARVKDRGEVSYDPNVSLSIVDRGDGLSGAISGVCQVWLASGDYRLIERGR